MATHLIVYGHGAGDPGAVGNRENERDFNRKKLHPHIKKWANKSKHKFEYYDVTGNRDMFQDTARGFGMYSINPRKYASVTEIHEDAASASAAGGHVIISSSFKPDREDLELAQAIKKIVGLWGGVSKTRGISYRNNLLNLNVAAKRGITYRLMELGFITSKRDMDIIKRDLDKYAREIIESITSENLGGTEVPKPKEKNPIAKETHKPRQMVRSYWFPKGHKKLWNLKNYCERNKIYFTESVVASQVRVNMMWFQQNSPSKTKLIKYLEDNNLNYDIKLEFYENF